MASYARRFVQRGRPPCRRVLRHDARTHPTRFAPGRQRAGPERLAPRRWRRATAPAAAAELRRGCAPGEVVARTALAEGRFVDHRRARAAQGRRRARRAVGGAAVRRARRRCHHGVGRHARQRENERAVAGDAAGAGRYRAGPAVPPAAIATCSACRPTCWALTRWASATCCSSRATRASVATTRTRRWSSTSIRLASPMPSRGSTGARRRRAEPRAADGLPRWCRRQPDRRRAWMTNSSGSNTKLSRARSLPSRCRFTTSTRSTGSSRDCAVWPAARCGHSAVRQPAARRVPGQRSAQPARARAAHRADAAGRRRGSRRAGGRWPLPWRSRALWRTGCKVCMGGPPAAVAAVLAALAPARMPKR